MENPLLKEPDIVPTAIVLEKVLGNLHPVFFKFISTIESERFSLIPEWRFYKDGNAWLCKIVRKKKTVVWLSVWSDCFKLAFYFTEKSGAGITDLKVQDSIRAFYLNHEPIGKLKPLVIEVRNESQLQDIYTIIDYKINQL